MVVNKDHCRCGKVKFTWKKTCGRCHRKNIYDLGLRREFFDIAAVKRVNDLQKELAEKDTVILYLQNELVKARDKLSTYEDKKEWLKYYHLGMKTCILCKVQSCDNEFRLNDDICVYCRIEKESGTKKDSSMYQRAYDECYKCSKTLHYELEQYREWFEHFKNYKELTFLQNEWSDHIQRRARRWTRKAHSYANWRPTSKRVFFLYVLQDYRWPARFNKWADS